MCTAEEAKSIKYWNSITNTLSTFYLFLWVPISFAFYAKYRQNPVENHHMRFRVLSIHLVQLPCIVYTSAQRQRIVDDACKKYLADLSDYEIKNFDMLYQQLN